MFYVKDLDLKIAFYSEHFLCSLSSEAMQSFLSHLHH